MNNVRIALKRRFFRTASWFGFLAIVAATTPLLAGCDDNNRVPTKAEVQAADTKRQASIDSMSTLTESQKEAMKAHMGGPSVASPAAAAQQAAQVQKDRR